MKRHEMLLTAALLDWAHTEFINHTCGDLPQEIKELLTEEQWVELSREYHAMGTWNILSLRVLQRNFMTMPLCGSCPRK